MSGALCRRWEWTDSRKPYASMASITQEHENGDAGLIDAAAAGGASGGDGGGDVDGGVEEGGGGGGDGGDEVEEIAPVDVDSDVASETTV